MRFPATITWCDREPECWQDFTISRAIDCARVLESALDQFERDVRRVQFPLLAELDDCDGNRFQIGFDGRQERGFLAYALKLLLTDEAGRYQFLPIRWSGKVSVSTVQDQIRRYVGFTAAQPPSHPGRDASQ
ncbi:MAG: hypothetical protein NT069_24095 [Planctomycetota bacterium]|nr:hypothetical protein [Planctomycetota bacterium]